MSTPAKKFMKDNGLAFRAVRVDSRPDGLGDIPTGPDHMVNKTWAEVENRHRRHFRVEFRTLASDFALVTFFSQGSAHTEAPTATEVLECLAIDARSVVDCTDVLDFAAEMGFASDDLWHDVVENLRKTFNACNSTLDQLDALLGEDAREELLDLDFDEE